MKSQRGRKAFFTFRVLFAIVDKCEESVVGVFAGGEAMKVKPNPFQTAFYVLPGKIFYDS